MWKQPVIVGSGWRQIHHRFGLFERQRLPTIRELRQLQR
jgi:hypothetical protein